jgi:plastocyanin
VATTAAGATPDVIVKNSDALKFDQKTYTAKAGAVTIELVNDPAVILHTLKMDGQKSLSLQVQGKGKTDTATIDLKPGTYTIYCDVPTHRSAGMEAKLIVS